MLLFTTTQSSWATGGLLAVVPRFSGSIVMPLAVSSSFASLLTYA